MSEKNSGVKILEDENSKFEISKIEIKLKIKINILILILSYSTK